MLCNLSRSLGAVTEVNLSDDLELEIMACSPEPFDEVLCFGSDNHRNLANCIHGF